MMRAPFDFAPSRTRRASARSGRCYLGARLAHAHQVGLDKRIDRAVEHGVGVADLDTGAMVLHHAIRLQDVGADLAAPGDVLFFLAELLELLTLLALLE